MVFNSTVTFTSNFDAEVPYWYLPSAIWEEAATSSGSSSDVDEDVPTADVHPVPRSKPDASVKRTSAMLIHGLSDFINDQMVVRVVDSLAGMVFAAHCPHVYDQLDEVLEELADVRRVDGGVVRVTLCNAPAAERFAAVFNSKYIVYNRLASGAHAEVE